LIKAWEVGLGIIFVAVWLPILLFSIAHWSTLPTATFLSIVTLVAFALFMLLIHEERV
jgi:hypothetical protein